MALPSQSTWHSETRRHPTPKGEVHASLTSRTPLTLRQQQRPRWVAGNGSEGQPGALQGCQEFQVQRTQVLRLEKPGGGGSDPCHGESHWGHKAKRPGSVHCVRGPRPSNTTEGQRAGGPGGTGVGVPRSGRRRTVPFPRNVCLLAAWAEAPQESTGSPYRADRHLSSRHHIAPV